MNENTQNLLMEASASSSTNLNPFIYTNTTVIVPPSSSSSILQQAIPIYSLKQTSPSFSSSNIDTTDAQNNKFLLTTAVNTSTSPKNDSEWTNSLFRPASRFTLKRRECKSTSDESFTFDVNATANVNTNGRMQSSGQNDLDVNNKIASNSCVKSRNDDFLLTSISSLNSGKFGFNPTGRRLSSLNGIITPNQAVTASNGNVFKKNHSFSNGAETTYKLASMKNQRDKKNVKRLSAGNKFYFDQHSKKSQEKKDYTHNKKLFHAISNNDYDTVVDLLESNLYDINCCDDKQRTCLHIASSKGNLEIVRLLLNYGANPNLRDCVCNLPIHLAIISSHVPVVTLLLEAGTDINTLDLNGKTVLHLAGTRLRWLLNDENNKASPKLKFEAIMIMNMIKEYLRQKKTSTNDLDILTTKLESVFTLDDINCLTKELLNKFETLNLTKLNGEGAASSH